MRVSDNGSPILADTATVIINLIDILEPILPVTNFVSPNDDGHNDYWFIQNVHLYQDYELAIYDVNGREVYRVAQYDNEWQGQRNNGNELPSGVYYYRFIKSNAVFTYKGEINLVR